MNRKIIISMLIIAVLSSYLYISNRSKDSAIELDKWDGNAEEIIIQQPGKRIRLVQRKGDWFVSDPARSDVIEYPADRVIVEDIEKSLKELKIVELISKKGFYKKYELTPNKYTEIIVRKNSKQFRKFTIGKKSSTFHHTYIKIDNKPEIYLAAETFNRILNKTADDLRSKEIFKIDSKEITYFEINHRGRIFAFSKIVEEKKIKAEKSESIEDRDKKEDAIKTEKWVCKGYENITFDKNKIDSFLSNFNPLKTTKYSELKKDNFGNPVCRIKVKSYEKEVSLSLVFKDKDNNYISTSSENPYVFIIDEWKAKKFLIKNIDGFKE